jgi:hypothetical protein
MLSDQFIAGYISACGSFLEYQRSGKSYFAFQIKSTKDNVLLLQSIASTLSLNNRIYVYDKPAQSYSLLVVRNTQNIEKILFPFFDTYLNGVKRQQYLDWKEKFIKYCSTRNYRNITATANPNSYYLVDKKPNKE